MSIAGVRKSLLVAMTSVLLVPGFSIAQQYHRTDLTANVTSASPSTTPVNPDSNLVNAWGLARASVSPWGVSDNGSGLSTLYNASGVPQSLVVKILTPDGKGTLAPTGVVFNPTTAFPVAPNVKAIFLFVTE